MKTFSFSSVLLKALVLSLAPFMATAAGAQTSYPVVTPASSAGAATRAIVSINQGDIYNQIGNATNTANYAVNVGAGAQNTANWAVNIGTAAQGSADYANSRIGNGGTVTKVGTAYGSGNYTRWTFMCLTAPYDGSLGNQELVSQCPGGSLPLILSTFSDSP